MVNAHTCKLAVCWDPLCFFFIQALQTGCCTCQHLNTWQVKQNFKNNLNIPDLVCPDCIKGAPCSFEEDILVRRESSLLPDLFFIYLDQPDLKVLLCLYSGGLVLDWEHLFYSIMENNNNNNNNKNNLSLCNFHINIVNIKILISKCLLQKHAVCRLLNMCLSLFLTPQPFAWLPQFDSVFPLNTSPCQDATPWPFSCEWRQLCFLWTFLAFPFINWWILPGKLTNYMHNLLHKTWNLPTSSSFFFLPVADRLKLSLWRGIRMMKSPWQQWWFWESEQSWLSQVSVLSPAPQDIELRRETTKKRYDWDEVCGWGCILPEIGCHLFHEAKLMDRQFFLFLQRHSCTTTGNQVGRGLKYFKQVLPCHKGWILSSGKVLTHLWEDGGRSRG